MITNAHMVRTETTVNNLDTMNHMDSTEEITAIAQIHEAYSDDMIQEAEEGTASTINFAIFMTVHVHQAIFALLMDSNERRTNIHVVAHPYSTYHVPDMEACNILKLIVNAYLIGTNQDETVEP